MLLRWGTLTLSPRSALPFALLVVKARDSDMVMVKDRHQVDRSENQNDLKQDKGVQVVGSRLGQKVRVALVTS